MRIDKSKTLSSIWHVQEAVAFNQILKATALFEVTMNLHLDTNCIGA